MRIGILFSFSLISLVSLIVPDPAQAQTAGSGTLASIESKANLIESTSKKIPEIEENIRKWTIEKQVRQEADKKRLADKLEEIEKSSSWENRRKSAKSGWKEHNPGECGAGGPPPTCPVNHWYRVSVSVAWAEYEAYRNKVLEDLHKSISNNEKNYDNKIREAQAQIEKLKHDIDDLRRQIVELSKSYKENVVQEGKSVQSFWIRDLMELVAEKHVLENRINIYNVKLNDLSAEQNKTIGELREKVHKRNEENKKQLTDKINLNKNKLFELEQAHNKRVSDLKDNMYKWGERLREVERRLRDTSGLNPGEVSSLISEKGNLAKRIENAGRDIENYESQFNQTSGSIEAENKTMSEKIWHLTTNLSRIQDEAIQSVKEAFETKRKVLHEGKTARTISLSSKGNEILNRRESSRQKFLTFASKVDSERIRLLKACQKAGCSCYGADTHGEIVGNWNKALGCVGEMESAHHSGDAIYGCSDESATYTKHYSFLQSGMSDSDAEALQRSSNRTRYDMIFKKVMN